MRKVVALLTAGSILFILTSCLLPNEFMIQIDIKPDLSYTFHYSGKLQDMFYMNATNTGKKLTLEEQKQYDDIDAQLLNEPGFKKIEKIGNGTYRVEYEHSGNAAEINYAFIAQGWPLIKFHYGENGGLYIQQQSLDSQNNSTFKSLNYSPNGKVIVKFDSNQLSLQSESNNLKLTKNTASFIFDKKNNDGFTVNISQKK